ncbi:MAG: hypothetical protein NTV94_10435 [Planctomycetota bacterium]|nr:hypothetical protein [Planctomycetota bacterium]
MMHIPSTLTSLTLALAAAACATSYRPRPASQAAVTTVLPSPVNICLAAPDATEPMPDAEKVPTITPVVQKLLVQYNGVQSSYTIAGSASPCLCNYTVDTRFEVSRTTDIHPPYTFWAGPLSGHRPLPGAFLLDRSDWDLDDKLGVASVSIQQGWGMMIRPRGYPPLRTIRITTGRPRFHIKTDNAPAQTEPLAAPTVRYAILGIIEPGATYANGHEYFFMREAKAGEEEKLTLMSISDGAQTTTLSSGEYVAFDRKTGTFEKPAKLPSLEDLSKAPFKDFVKEAVCAAFKASNERFFSGSPEKCN